MNTHPPKLAEATSTPSVRTLVVDDSPFMLRILAQTLQEAGKFDLVGTATDGCQALRYASELSPELVLIDFHLPHLNGIQATRSIKDCEHPPVVIVITSDDSSGARSMAEEAGADAFIVKTGSLYLRLTRTLQNLFGPRGARRAAAGGNLYQTAPAAQPNQDHST